MKEILAKSSVTKRMQKWNYISRKTKLPNIYNMTLYFNLFVFSNDAADIFMPRKRTKRARSDFNHLFLLVLYIGRTF